MSPQALLPDLDRELGTLKDFQRHTVDYVFRRLYVDEPPAHRFLVADEVGLGKTLVARGVIARTLHHLYDHEHVDRIDVVYVCSNSDIARQNLNRLNVTGRSDVIYPTRLTLLPTQVRDLRSRRINFVSLTPGTSLETSKSRMGRKEERVLLYRMLRDFDGLDERGLRNLLQAMVGRRQWHRDLERLAPDYDEDLADDFRNAIRLSSDLGARLHEATNQFREFWQPDLIRSEDRELRYSVIGRLRGLLATVCIEALEPDLIILDEFQRFRDLLDGDTEAANLTRRLLNYQEASGYRARVLLLSATPYRMLSYQAEEEDHHEDFLRTCRFLFEDDARRTTGLRRALRDYRRALFRFGLEDDGNGRRTALIEPRDRVQDQLLSVMVRTERTDAVGRRSDDLLREKCFTTSLEPSDLQHARVVDRLARAVEARGHVEYWKSAPYLPNLMHGYALKDELLERLPKSEPDVVTALERGQEVGALLDREMVNDWQDLDPANGRLRKLLADTADKGMWRLLWMPPSLAYLDPAGPFADMEDVTKGLVFSSWRVVPQAIAALCSYAAERRMLEDDASRSAYDQLHRGATRPIEFTLKDGRPSGMNPMMLLYPSPTLARLGDPLDLAVQAGGPMPHERALEVVENRVRRALDAAEIDVVYEGRGAVPDYSWYRVALARLDADRRPEMKSWVRRRSGWRNATHGQVGEGFGAHLEEFAEGYDPDLSLGHAPTDLTRVLAELALAGPAVCAHRALQRVGQVEDPTNPDLLAGAVKVGLGFRSLFNAPDVVGLFRGREGSEDLPYWRDVLHYGQEGNLQAVLDEHAHMLRDSLGLMDGRGPAVASQVADKLAEVLGLSAGHIHVDEFVQQDGFPGSPITTDRFQIRTRFALQFGRIRDDRGETVARRGGVRDAFNSPFRPFVMATTSVGQEGLDFHTWCHAVYHWNLPANPVDLEQREGRIHRYKGHAIRKNVARRFGIEAFGGTQADERPADPWARLFELAEAKREPGSSDLVPFWLFDGPASVERRVPLPPFSREVQRLGRLKKGLALYRMVFGQPRQEDLLEYLQEHASDLDPEELLAFRISLAPPDVELDQEPVEIAVGSKPSERATSGHARTPFELATALLRLVRRFDPDYELHRTDDYYGLTKEGEADNFVVMRSRRYGLRLDAKIREDDPVVEELREAGFELNPYHPDWARPGVQPIKVHPGHVRQHGGLLERVLESAYQEASRYS